ncbi:MAG: hypothetical protein CME31_15430 [Gimesia sp.]|nr:hypothetical protein [Gimesia sp.]
MIHACCRYLFNRNPDSSGTQFIRRVAGPPSELLTGLNGYKVNSQKVLQTVYQLKRLNSKKSVEPVSGKLLPLRLYLRSRDHTTF